MFLRNLGFNNKHMPKPHTFPTLLDEVHNISITNLKQWDYLKPDSWKSGIITWSRNGNKTGSVSISVDMDTEPFMQLSYKSNGEPVDYKVKLVSVPSNLGKGQVWYFLCPHTGKLCRKLFAVGKFFLHRKAFPNAMYEKQTYSSKNRQLCKVFEKAFSSERVYEQLMSKYFKTHYAGKPTKRYLKLMKQLEYSRQFNQTDYEQMLTGFYPPGA